MQLDVIIATYNRAASLERATRSLLAAPVPEGHAVRIFAADNGSKDETRAVVERLAAETAGRVVYVEARQGQGKSFALNAGIESSSAELVGFIDDDEEIAMDWYARVFALLSDPSVDYVGGPYVPHWPVPPPAWIHHPRALTAIAGAIDFGTATRRFNEPGFEALLMGGNCVIRRRCFDKVGLYNNALSRTPTSMGGEDTEMHERLLAAGFTGVYCPEVLIHHHIPEKRMNKRYMRHWAFSAAAADGYQFRNGAGTGRRLFGLPQWVYGNVARAPVGLVRAVATRQGAAVVFYQELRFWQFAGTFWGRHFMKFPE